MALTTKEKIKEAAKEADEKMFGAKPPEDTTGTEGEPKPPEGEVKPPEGGTPEEPKEPKVEEPKPPETPAAPDASALQTEIDALKVQLQDANKAEAKYSTLQGMFNKLSEELRGVKQELQDAKDTAAKPPAPEPTSENLDKLKRDYGDSIIGDLKVMVSGVVKDAIAEALGAPTARIAKVEENQGRTDKENFFIRLAQLVPDWKQINGWKEDAIMQDPKWRDFLLQQIPGMSDTYDKVINDHFNKYDADSVAKIFNLYKDSKPAPPASGDTPPAPKPKKPDINKHIDPGSSAGGGTATPSSSGKEKTYTRKEVDDFFNSLRKRTFYGSKEEAEKLKNEYNTAIMEDRVI
jgi:hypothetical protein